MRATRTGRAFVAIVTALGAVVFAGLLLADGGEALATAEPAAWMFAGLVLVGELWPIKVGRQDDAAEVTTSTAFSFALLLSAGTVLAVIAQVVATVVADLARDKPLSRVAFNGAQYTLALAAGGLVLLHASSGRAVMQGASLDVADLVPLVLTAGCVYLLNYGLTVTAIALHQHGSVLASLRRDLAFNASTAGVMLAISPVLVVVAAHSLPLIPLLLLTVVALYKSALVSVEREHEALHDLLTGLPNRRLFCEHVRTALADSRRARRTVAVMLIDLDRFKEINDMLGHHVGDVVLQQVGPRLSGALPDLAAVARLSGDEFAVVLPHCAGRSEAAAAAEHIMGALTDPFLVQGFPLEVEASVGVALADDDDEDVTVLLQRADIAMYVAKRARTGYELYSEERDQHNRGRLALLGQLRRAIDECELVVHYQPLADIDTGAVRAVEALVRWDHPEHGLVYPDEFIPLAEHTELIGPLTRFVLDTALAQSAAWHALGLHVAVAVNLSVQNLYDTHFARAVGDLLARHDVPADALELEITENTVMADPVRAQAVLADLHEMGVRLAIDDFGTGYSSLAYLRQLPVDQIKIDKSFVRDMLEDEDDAVIVRSLVELGRNLGLQVVAEGVEDAAVWQRLAEQGCHLAQGFHLCRPTPPGLLTPWLQQAAARVPTARHRSSLDPQRHARNRAPLQRPDYPGHAVTRPRTLPPAARGA